MKAAPKNTDDVIDSRDVIARIEELRTERDEVDTFAAWDASEAGDELRALEALADKASSSPDWEYGETLIRDSYFQTYAQELADDIGAVDRNATWPNNCIDWEWAVRDLKFDGEYFAADFDGVQYWLRA